MGRIALFLLIPIFVMNGCRNGGADDKIEDDTDDRMVDDGSDDDIEVGTLVVEASFEGSMLPFVHEYDGADIFTDPTAPDGDQVLRFTYPPGHPSGYSTDLAWVCLEQSTTEAKVEYYFKYSEHFFFHRVANKQLYVVTGEHTDFVISAVDTIHTGCVGIGSILQIGCQDSNVGMTELKNPNMADNVTIYANKWFKVTLYFKLNKDGQRNGILKLWVDDKLIMDYADMLFNRGIDANTPFSCLKFDPVWGGVGDPKPNATDYFYVDAVKIWVGPFKW